MTDQRIHIVVLAAGLSRRFGASKLLEHWRDTPLVRHAVRAAQEVAPGKVFLVTGPRADDVAAAAAADVTVNNDDYAAGIGSSLACGVRTAREGADAVIIQLGDQPLITAAHLRRLVARWSGDADEIVATRSSASLCPPVLFGGAAFAALCRLQGDAGARSVMQDPRFTVREVPFADADVDIDTPNDLEALRGN